LAPDTPADRRIHGLVRHRESLGSEVMAHIVIPVKMAMTEDVRELAEDVGDDRTLEADADEAPETTIVGRFGNRSRVAEGDRVEVSVDTRALHFFDPDTGLGIYDDQRGGQA
jgi:multiple sugar transport system ATP-binding protein